MEYDKDKINKIVDFKDKLQNEEIRESIEWLIQNYNEYYVCHEEFEEKYKEYKDKYYKYYTVLEENQELKERIKRYKSKCHELRIRLNEVAKNNIM